MFSILDYVVSNFVLPFNAFLIALSAGWAINAQRMRADIGMQGERSRALWQFSVRWLAPLAVISVFLASFL